VFAGSGRLVGGVSLCSFKAAGFVSFLRSATSILGIHRLVACATWKALPDNAPSQCAE
jgi:hypothetical protein